MNCQTKYFFFRNDYSQEYFEFFPEDQTCLDKVDYKYFGRLCHYLSPLIKNMGLKVFISPWTVHELPEYGANVVSFITQDEWGRSPRFRNKVGLIFKTCGTFPYNFASYKFGGIEDKVTSFLAHSKAFSLDRGGHILGLFHKLSGSHLAPVYDIPLGVHSYESEPIPYMPIHQRVNDLYFAGSSQHTAGTKLKRPKEIARERMMRSLNLIKDNNSNINVKFKVTNNFEDSISQDPDQYLKDMMNTKICPIPRGANLETFRFYEAIRYGCIPVGEAFPDNEFYRLAPILRLSDWSELASKILPILNDREMLDSLHRIVISYWKNVCSEQAVADYTFSRIVSWYFGKEYPSMY